MEALILTVLGLGLTVAVCSPISVVSVIALLSMTEGRRRAVAFVVGWLLAIVAIDLIVVFVLHGQDFRSHRTTSSRAASAVEVLVGVVAVVLSARAFRRRPRGASSEPPKWLARLDRTSWLIALPVGAFMLTYSLTLAAASEILKANVSTGNAVLASAVFAAASITSIVAPLIVVLVTPERSATTLATWHRWLLGNARSIGLILLIAIGAALIVRGIHDLVG